MSLKSHGYRSISKGKSVSRNFQAKFVNTLSGSVERLVAGKPGEFLVFLGLLLSATFFRFFSIGRESFWSDELFSVSTALSLSDRHPWYPFAFKNLYELTFEDSFLTRKAADNTPPLYEAMLFLWSLLFGESDTALRSLSATLGVAAVAVVYIGLRRVGPHGAAIVAAALLAASPGAITYSQEARAYSLAMFFCTVAVVRLTSRVLSSKILGKKKEPLVPWVDIAILIALAYSHYTGLILAGALAGIHILMISKKPNFVADTLRFLLVPLSIAPWILLSTRTLASSLSAVYAFQATGLEEVFDFMIPVSSFFLFPVVGFFPLWPVLYFWVRAQDWMSHRTKNAFRFSKASAEIVLSLLLFLSLIAFFLYSIATGNITGLWHERYFVVGIPVAIVSLVLILSRVTSNLVNGRNLSILLVALSFAASLQAATNIPLKEDYRGASDWVASNYNSDSVIVMGWGANEAYYRHYLDRDARLQDRLINFETISFEPQVSSLCRHYAKGFVRFLLIQHWAQPYYGYLSECTTLTEIERLEFRGVIVVKFESVQGDN